MGIPDPALANSPDSLFSNTDELLRSIDGYYWDFMKNTQDIDAIDKLIDCLHLFRDRFRGADKESGNQEQIPSQGSQPRENANLDSKLPSENDLAPEPQFEGNEVKKLFSEPGKYKELGTILIENNLIDQKQLDSALQLQKSKLGEILVGQGILAQQDLDNALKLQKKVNGSEKLQEYIKLPLSRINRLLDYFGEQVILLSVLEKKRLNQGENGDLIDNAVAQLGKVTGELQQTALSLRMDTLNSLFIKTKSFVSDISRELGKKVRLETYGEGTEVDKAILDDLFSAIRQIVRNSIDHGIESKDERIAAKKPEEGIIRLRAFQKGGLFLLEIEDDGRGIDCEKIRSSSLDKGLMSKDKALSSDELTKLLFAGGFSAKNTDTNTSHRIAGVTAINDTIKKFKGSCQVESELGIGTRITIRLPLTLAMFKGTIVKINNQKFVIPNSDYRETISIPIDSIQRLNDEEDIVKIRDKVVRLIYIDDFISTSQMKAKEHRRFKTYEIINEGKKSCEIVGFITSDENQDYLIPVDEFVSQDRIVFKKLGNEAQNFNWVSGGTILGDGNVAFILDLAVVMSMVKK